MHAGDARNAANVPANRSSFNPDPARKPENTLGKASPRHGDPSHQQKAICRLTESSIQLMPLLAQMGAWGRRHTQASRALSIRAQLLGEGGSEMWSAFMVELRSFHLGAPARTRSVIDELNASYEPFSRSDGNSPTYST